MSWQDYICTNGCYSPQPLVFLACDDCNAAEFYDIIDSMMAGEDVTDRWKEHRR